MFSAAIGTNYCSSGVLFSRYQPIKGSLLPLQITEPASSGKCEKMISHQCEWAFHYHFFAEVEPNQ
jgi:hypothetical protein